MYQQNYSTSKQKTKHNRSVDKNKAQ